MRLRFNVFTKISLLVLLLLIPVISLYTYSNRESVSVIENEIQNNTTNRLSTFASQVESNIYQLSLYGVSIGQDSSIQDFQRPDYIKNPYERVKLSVAILEKMNLYNAASKWHSIVTLYFPRTQDALSTDYYATYTYEANDFANPLPRTWHYADGSFTWYTTEPLTAMSDPRKSRLITKISFPATHLTGLLDQNKANNSGDPFLFNADMGTIRNGSANEKLIAQLGQQLKASTLNSSGGFRTELDGTEYYVSYIHSKSLGWYYVDYVPMQRILSPITNSRNLFYTSIAVLLVMSLAVVFIIYRSVQLPLLQLVRGTRRLSSGDFSVRLQPSGNNEFSLVLGRFNIMAQRIQELIENVYEEKLRRREATLKQLQSQIDPHFLYNCLFYIKNMARMKNEEAVVAMSLNLGEYFRYITRSENDLATVREEINMVSNYLKIQSLRLERMTYTIEMPDELLNQPVSRLTLQPIIENAIIHGLEPQAEDGEIRIRGSYEDGCCTITVEDSGVGMADEGLSQLQQNLAKPLDGNMGCGTWNVHQRLTYLFGEQAGLTYARSELGGVRITIAWQPNNESAGGHDATALTGR
ncbi:integral membrane sensor signal transduction histidine kinase [Paenibacillus curdlanolyticus YK9]|uniref:Integral membrane sensor signal transduction histidine kinase n=1 Tax=Paenibacillus curdlanolyticus YK9 TaxID=717606 RepID=E0IG68_9BACL|nr:sensor histidine kinase [Paenibacillus curdlanolyticus]EFM08470.1 integral membrane sensor signal transduction histidine kinase [Paenibacillus curdlanolyticus YK9]